MLLILNLSGSIVGQDDFQKKGEEIFLNFKSGNTAALLSLVPLKTDLEEYYNYCILKDSTLKEDLADWTKDFADVYDNAIKMASRTIERIYSRGIEISYTPISSPLSTQRYDTLPYDSIPLIPPDPEYIHIEWTRAEYDTTMIQESVMYKLGMKNVSIRFIIDTKKYYLFLTDTFFGKRDLVVFGKMDLLERRKE